MATPVVQEEEETSQTQTKSCGAWKAEASARIYKRCPIQLTTYKLSKPETEIKIISREFQNE